MKIAHVLISVPLQQLTLYVDQKKVNEYAISTAKKGVGEESDSFCTPRGLHIIRAKIGANVPLHAVFSKRRLTGEIYSPELAALYPDRDWILTRILWLSGLEIGKNRLGRCDTMRRYIYIHGTSDEANIGQPLSHGCIRMLNRDIIELFDKIDIGTKVIINE